MKIGILNSGGDVQGINAVIASVVQTAHSNGLDYKFIGYLRGWEGVLDGNYINLDLASVNNISNLGGTILYSVNKGRFSGKVGKGRLNQIPPSVIAEAKQNLAKEGVDALVVIGGDGTLSAALQLANAGVNIVGVPKTIDNDLVATEQTFGFSTAVSIAMDAIDRVFTTAMSHERVIFVETMGRHVGWIALYAGLAGGAHGILIPEFDFDYAKLIDFIRSRSASGNTYSIIVVSEGAKPIHEEQQTLKVVTRSSEVKLSGISDRIITKIEELAPGEFEMRNVVLGHTQRGGSPNAEDRILAKSFGVGVINAIQKKQFGKMVCLSNNHISVMPISEAVSKLNRVTKDCLAYTTAKSLGIFLPE